MGNHGDIVGRLGYRIRLMRGLAELTQEELATRAGISRSFLTRIEAGNTEAKLTTLTAIAGALGVTLSHLLGEGPPPERPETEAVRLLRDAVVLVRGVEIRHLGSVMGPSMEVRADEPGSRYMVRMPREWGEGFPPEAMFELDVMDESQATLGIPRGSRVVCVDIGRVEPDERDVGVFRMHRSYSLLPWFHVARILSLPDGEGDMLVQLRDGTTLPAIGIVLYSYLKWH